MDWNHCPPNLAFSFSFLSELKIPSVTKLGICPKDLPKSLLFLVSYSLIRCPSSAVSESFFHDLSSYLLPSLLLSSLLCMSAIFVKCSSSYLTSCVNPSQLLPVSSDEVQSPWNSVGDPS